MEDAPPSTFEIVRSKLLEKIEAKTRKVQYLEAAINARSAKLEELRSRVQEQADKLGDVQANNRDQVQDRKAFEAELSKLGDLATALEACHTLETISNAQLVERQRQLQAHFRDLVEDLQKHKSKIEELVSKLEVVEAMPLQNRTPKQLKEDEDVRGIFDLGPDQFLICEHTCTHNDASGKVFLTPGFLCFGASRDTSNNFKVSYHDIGLVEKVQRKNRLGVDVGKGIKVTMEDSTEYVFSAFPNRSIAFRDILSQGTFHSLSWALNIGESSRSSLPIADEKV